MTSVFSQAGVLRKRRRNNDRRRTPEEIVHWIHEAEQTVARHKGLAGGRARRASLRQLVNICAVG